MPLEAAPHQYFAAICIETHRKDPAWQRLKGPYQVEVVADHAFHLPVHAIKFRSSIRTTDEQFILLRVSRDGLQPTFQRAGSNAGDIVHEPLRGHLNELQR